MQSYPYDTAANEYNNKLTVMLAGGDPDPDVIFVKDMGTQLSMDFLRIGTKIRNYNNLQKFIHANLYIFLRNFCLLRVKYPAYKNQ